MILTFWRWAAVGFATAFALTLWAVDAVRPEHRNLALMGAAYWGIR